MNTRELKEALKVAAQWAEWQQESLDDFHAYAQMFGAQPGGNVFDFALGDALKLRGLTWDKFHQKRAGAEKRESQSGTITGEQGVTSTGKEVVPAATQEQPAGSETAIRETAVTWLSEHKKAWSAYDLFSLIRIMQPGSPRKVGEDGALHCNAPNPDGSYFCNKEAGHSGYHVHSFINPDGENDFYMWAARPSSVPVGEQKQEEGV